jgi:hypothetical protein
MASGEDRKIADHCGGGKGRADKLRVSAAALRGGGWTAEAVGINTDRDSPKARLEICGLLSASTCYYSTQHLSLDKLCPTTQLLESHQTQGAKGLSVQ